MSAKIIMFDGPDGVGKTTQLELTYDSLTSQGLKVLKTRVNGGSPIGEEIRKAYLSMHDRPVETDMHLALALAYALGAYINEQQDHDIVLVDRSPYSIMAYQAFASGLDIEEGKRACEQSTKAIKPDLVLIYNAPQAVLNGRRNERPDPVDGFFEAQSQDYQSRLQEGYAFAAKTYNVPIIDATGTPEEVHARTMKAIQSVIK